MDLSEPDAAASEVSHRLDDCAVVGAARIHQDTVHIENDDLGPEPHHSLLSAPINLCVCARVPTVMRT